MKYFSFIPKIILPIGLILFLSSCSASFHCSKCLESGIPRDTITKTVHDTIPKVQIETIFTPQLVRDTVIYKDRAVLKIVKLPGESILVECECDTIVVTKTETKILENEIKTGYTKMHLIGSVILGVLIALIVGLVAGLILKR